MESLNTMLLISVVRLKETLVEDPRLGPLPAGWSRKSHKAKRLYSLFVERVETDEETDTYGTKMDP
jgi:hypothetical protein